MKKLLALLTPMLSLPLLAVEVPLGTLTKLSTVPAGVRPYFLNLVTEGEGYRLSPDSEEAKELANTKDIGPALIELAERVYENAAEDDWDHLLGVFNILQIVPALSETDLKPVRKRLIELWNKEDLPQVATYKQGGLFLLGNHPSPSSEDVLIKYLDERVGPGMAGMSGPALISLTKIARPNSLKALDLYIKRYGTEFYAGKLALQTKEAIEKRMAETKPAQK